MQGKARLIKDKEWQGKIAFLELQEHARDTPVILHDKAANVQAK